MAYGAERDVSKAFEWYGKAAENGFAEAQYKLGKFFAEGSGVKKDAGAAAMWYRRAAEKGLPAAQLALGDCYYYGSGVKKNSAEAEVWYKRAKESGKNLKARASARLGCGALQPR